MENQEQVISEIARGEGCFRKMGKIGAIVLALLEGLAALIAIYQFLSGTQSLPQIQLGIPNIPAIPLPNLLTRGNLLDFAPLNVICSLIICGLQSGIWWLFIQWVEMEEKERKGCLGSAFITLLPFDLIAAYLLSIYFRPSDLWTTVLFFFIVFMCASVVWGIIVFIWTLIAMNKATSSI
ncbi:hypothetical protein [Ktedonospora formicarum]|uniref:Uncharacterized protein n=1 Tax=Ktedonospora formicarum TaxID=2778364 RepID=A0A8J3I9V9_9CHLR|nr:hypothetical protein [Ktedonospora formicarum]GHO48682.1 hypothetical protein KSX_68450 [Ktedonospora formicarum]